MEMPGLLRVPYKLEGVVAVVPPAEIPLAELEEEGSTSYTLYDDQRHVLLKLTDRKGMTHSLALDRSTAMKLYSDLAEALKRLENCHER